MSLTYKVYCEWFLKIYNRPFAASEAEFNDWLHKRCYRQIEDPHYRDGEEDREGLYR